MRFVVTAAAAMLLVVPACSSNHGNSSTCDKPSSTTYDCTYALPEAGACEATDAFAPQSVGCVATLPACSPEAPQTAEKYVCTDYLDAGAQWKPY
jgi:hypothetical protein